MDQYGIHFIHASDEWYILAGKELPEETRYDGYLQLENGVGMMRLLETEVKERLAGLEGDNREFTASVATGKLAAPFIQQYMKLIQEKFPNIKVNVYTIRNDFLVKELQFPG